MSTTKGRFTKRRQGNIRRHDNMAIRWHNKSAKTTKCRLTFWRIEPGIFLLKLENALHISFSVPVQFIKN
jgi:hypothetical protein